MYIKVSFKELNNEEQREITSSGIKNPKNFKEAKELKMKDWTNIYIISLIIFE